MGRSMSTGDDQLLLPPEPSSAGEARRMVETFVHGHGIDEHLDAATLLVSEVVTNAVLHAATDVAVSCHSDGRALRIGVRDGSAVQPGVRHYGESAVTGRGLGLVEMLADDWGVDVDAAGKTVWFQLGTAQAPAPTTWPSSAPAPSPESFTVHLEALPVALVAATIEYTDAVLRDFSLMSMDADDATLEWPPPQIDLTPLLSAVEQAAEQERETVDIDVDFPVGTGAAALGRLALAEEAERSVLDGAMLTAPAPPEITLCRRWMLTQIDLQENGAAPEPWEMPAVAPPVLDAARVPTTQIEQLADAAGAVVVADDGNRIVYVNAAAAELLGWTSEELTGRRLLSIIPPEMRVAHLAGFTRYLLTSRSRILGRPVQLPLLHRDGSRIDAELLIEPMSTQDHRVAFIARLSAVEQRSPIC